MNRLLMIFGALSLSLWSFVAFLSKGLPVKMVNVFDRITFHCFSSEINKMQYGFYYDVDNSNMPTVAFAVIFFALFFIYMFLIKKIERTKLKRSALGVIVLFSVLFRLVSLPGEPIHENDFYRYLWDGKSINNGINPFKYAPADLFMYEEGKTKDYYDRYNDVVITAKKFMPADRTNLDHLIALRNADLTHFLRIGHWQVPTIYPPVAQMVFALSAFLKEDSFYVMKFLFFVFDLGIIFLIIGLLKHFNQNPAMMIVYGWSPLVIKEFANSGHYDPVAVFFTLLSIYLFFKEKHLKGVFVLALAALSKFFSGVLLPFFLKKHKIISAIIFAGTCLLFYLPFFIWDNTQIKGVFQGLSTYNEQWSYNSSVFAVVFRLMEFVNPAMTETLFPAKVFVALGYLCFMMYLWCLKPKSGLDQTHVFFLSIVTLFIINPVGDPWYFCWSIPFLCFFPYRSWLLLSALLILSYLNFHSEFAVVNMKYMKIPVISWIIYVPFFSYLIFEWIKKPLFLEALKGEKDEH